MRKSIKALLATGLILLPLTACKATMEAEEEASYPVTYALEKNHEYTLTDYDFQAFQRIHIKTTMVKYTSSL